MPVELTLCPNLILLLSGIGLGFGLKKSRDGPWSRREAMYVKYIGELFLNMLKCVIIPLVVPSLIAAIGKIHRI